LAQLECAPRAATTASRKSLREPRQMLAIAAPVADFRT
jgi:hypothetical protein